MPSPTALLDANVLYPAGLRDLLLRLADRYLYAPLWSADIHEEWMRSLLADRRFGRQPEYIVCPPGFRSADFSRQKVGTGLILGKVC